MGLKDLKKKKTQTTAPDHIQNIGMQEPLVGHTCRHKRTQNMHLHCSRLLFHNTIKTLMTLVIEIPEVGSSQNKEMRTEKCQVSMF